MDSELLPVARAAKKKSVEIVEVKIAGKVTKFMMENISPETQYNFKTFHPNPSLEYFPEFLPRIEFPKLYDTDPVPAIRLQQTTKYELVD